MSGPAPIQDDFLDPGRPRTTGIALTDRFGVPPLTALDARSGYWGERKAEWRAFGVRGEEGRSQVLLGTSLENLRRKVFEGRYGAKKGHVLPPSLSVFDPVLCEFVYRWFCPPGGSVLDPFAGESTKGVVASALGLRYVGVEIRPEQVAANEERAHEIGSALSPPPRWLVGDSAQLLGVVAGAGAPFDFVWTSPPYYDLEMYEGGESDGSTFGTYPEFMAWYEGIFHQAVDLLRPNRFLAVKVGDVRDQRGAYRGFVADNVKLFMRLGLAYYNSAVLLTPLASAPLRAGLQFSRGRKLTKAHQEVLVFYKGDPRDVKKHFPDERKGGK